MDETQTGITTLEKSLKGGKRQLTLGDAASLSALDMDDAKRALDALVEKYDSKLKVTENGDLIYDFGASLHRRGEKTANEIWTEVQEKAWQVFKFLFRIGITVMLIVYFVLFVLILIGLVVASMSRDDDDSDGGGLNFFQMYIIVDLFTDLFMYRTISRNVTYRTDEYGYTYKMYEPVGRIDKKSGKKKKSFVASVYDFVFGPPRFVHDVLSNYKEVAAYLRKEKAVMVQSEVVGLAGLKRDIAENFFTECLVKFKGNAEITENGTLYGEFNELVRGKAELDDTQVQWYWDEYEAPHQQSGNTTMRDSMVGGMNGLNLVFSVMVMNGFLYQVLPGFPTDTLSMATTLLGIVPFTFSSIFFLIPTVRFFKNKKKNAEIRKQNIRKRLMKAIFYAKQGILSENELVELVNTSGKEEKLNSAQTKEIMEDLVFDFGGELKMNENAELHYHFEDFKREMEEVQKIRANRKGDANLGEVVFDTGEE